MSDERQTAIHEAGHAVARERLRMDNDRITIEPDDETGTAGTSRGEGQSMFPELAPNNVLVSLAGYAALVVAGYSDEEARAGAGPDFAEAEEDIAYGQLDGSLETWLSKAVELMRQPENIAAVQGLADQLIVDRTLSGDEAAIVISCIDEAEDVALHLERFRERFRRLLAGRGGPR